MDGLGGHALVPRVDGDARPKATEAVRASELAQDERAVALFLTLDELVRAKCHPLTETGDHEGVRNGK